LAVFLLVVGEGLVVLSFCVRNERREQALPYDLGVSRERGAMQTVDMVRTCPHLISHQYTWRFFVGCGRGFGGFIFLCAGRTAVGKPPPYTFDRLILWSDGRPPKTLSLFNAGKAVALIPHGQFAARPFLCKLPACFGGKFALLLLFGLHFGFALW
jgi:hypothetical protein